MHRASSLTLAVAILLTACPAIESREPLPYRLEIEAGFGPQRGPGQLLDDVRLELLSALDRAHCFDSVDPVGEGRGGSRDLLLRVTLDNVLERTDVETSLAARNDPDAPPDVARQMVAQIEAMVTAEILLADRTAVVRSRRFLQANHWRPVLNEDPRYEARTLMVDELVSTVRSFACKGKPKKWSKQLARAREATPSAGSR